MPRVEIPLIGPAYTNREKPLSAQKAINMWPEINPEARNQVCLHNAAGTRVFATLSGIDRGMHDYNNLMYAVNGTTLYSIDETGAHSVLGTIPGTGRCQMADDGYQLIIVTGATPYRYTVATGLEAITDPDLINPTCVAYINSQFIFDHNDGAWGEFVTSSIEEGLAVDALDFATAESHPDDITAIIAYRQLVYFFGSHSVEPWSNTGTGNPPFARASSGVRPFGVAGRDAVLTTSEYIYFLDHDRIPRRSNGLDFPSIGTPALGVEFAKYSKIDDCIAYQFIQDGQQFVAFTFPTANRTWCFHEPSGSWFQLVHGIREDRHRASSMLNIYGLNYCADHSNGYIYEYSLDIYSDNGDAIIKQRDTAVIHGGLFGVPGKKLYFDEVEFIIVAGQTDVSGTGLGVQPGQTPVDPPAYVRQDRVIVWWELEEPTDAAVQSVYLFPEQPLATSLKWLNYYTSVTGVRGQAGLIDADTSMYADMDNQAGVPALDLADQVWGCTFWYKTHSTLTGEADRYILFCWNTSTPTADQQKWRFMMNATENGFVFSMGQGPNVGDITNIDTGDISLQASTWYHLAATHDPVANEMTFTVSERGGTVGTRQSAAIAGGAYVGSTPSYPINIANTGTAGTNANGAVDMIAFWDTTAILSEEDVFNLFTYELKYSMLTDPVVLTTIVDDDFTDTNGTLIAAHTPTTDTVGGGWLNTSAGWDMQGNNATSLTNNGAGLNIATIECSEADVVITATINRGADQAQNYTSLGIVFRLVDVNNYWYAVLTREADVRLYEVVAGTHTSRGAVGVRTFTASTDFELKLTLSGNHIKFFVDGLHGTTYLSTVHQAATQHGIFANDDAFVVKDFNVSKLTTVTSPSPDGQTEIVAPYWENTGNWIDLTALTQTTFASMFGVTIEGADFNSVHAVNKAALVNTADAGNRLQIQNTTDCSNAYLAVCDASGNVIDYMVYANEPNGMSVLVPTGADYYVVLTSDTGNAKVKKWDSSTVDTSGSVSWESWFGTPIASRGFWDETKAIPDAGISIRFTVPTGGGSWGLSFTTIETTSVGGTRTGSINQTVGDYTSAPTYTWGIGGGLTGDVNSTGGDITLIEGETYIFNVRNDTPSAVYSNLMRIQVAAVAQ